MVTIRKLVTDPATGIASVVSADVATIPIHLPALSYFVADEPLRLATPLGLVQVATGDRVVLSESGEATLYQTAAFERDFVADAPPAVPPPAPESHEPQ